MLIATLSLAATVIPSLALPTPRAADQPATAASAPEAGPALRPAQRYCVTSTTTGTRIPQRECRTRAEWLRDGFDPLAKD